MKLAFSSIRTGAWTVIGMLAATLLVSSCNKNNNDNDNIASSGVMAFNLASDVPQASIALSGNLLTTMPLAYNSYTGGYLGVFSGSRPVKVFNSNNGKELASTPFDFVAKKYYSIFVVGADSSYRAVVSDDNLDSLTAGTGQALVRYINAIPDSSHPNVTISNAGSESAGFASVSSFKPVTAGSVNVAVSNGGTINKSRDITLEQRGVYTVLLTGVPGSTASDSLSIRFIKNGTLDEASIKSVVSPKSVN